LLLDLLHIDPELPKPRLPAVNAVRQ